MLTRHQIGTLWKRLRKTNWTIDKGENHDRAFAFIKDALFDKTLGGLPAALYAATIEEVYDRVRFAPFDHPIDFDDDALSMLGDSIRSRSCKEKVDLAADFMILANDISEAGDSDHGMRLLAIAYGLLPRVSEFTSRSPVRELVFLVTEELNAYLDGQYADCDDIDAWTFKTHGDLLKEVNARPT